MKEYTLKIKELIKYIEMNFTGINYISRNLIQDIADYLKNNNCNLAGVNFQGEKIYVESFLYDFLSMLNDSGIDISLQELIKNNILEEVEK